MNSSERSRKREEKKINEEGSSWGRRRWPIAKIERGRYEVRPDEGLAAREKGREERKGRRGEEKIMLLIVNYQTRKNPAIYPFSHRKLPGTTSGYCESAMIEYMVLVSSGTGSVPILSKIPGFPHYDGEVMAPFAPEIHLNF